MTEATDTAPLRAELERQAQPNGQKNVLDLLQRSKPEIEKLLPSGVGSDRFERIVRTEIRRTPKLLECDPYSFLGAVMHCAQLGLEPGPLQLIHLIPFEREVQVIVGYRGYIEIGFRSGQLKDVSASLVHGGDVFEYREGTRPFLDHEPRGPAGEREIVAAYAVARLKTGGAPFRVIYEEDWEKARIASQLGRKNRGLWAEHRPAAILKTAYRRLEPKLPKSPALMYAAAVDERPALRIDDMIETTKETGDVLEAVIAAPDEDDVQEVGEDDA